MASGGGNGSRDDQRRSILMKAKDLLDSVNAMKSKWLNYYQEFPNIYLIALCFDPRCRLEGLPEYLTVYYRCLEIEYYPILAMIVKQILSTPVSTMAGEQEFSTDGNILDARRSLLSPQSIQMQVCADDWTKAQNRQQEIDQDAHASYDFFKDDQLAESGTDDNEKQ
ncbi:hypothetical protein Dsin_018288 [Dipteronia sinensis]|uniref:HAT C-terminal dimerisation domain-containing protein n=1 Tax=Dipteronia sinensis TaxID=43782 RepID=A0AAE0A527_9ROSI|nr:hypothetical protein Dsin_018288 [Dipteronia sinensis]